MSRNRFLFIFVAFALCAVVSEHWTPGWTHYLLKPAPAILCAWFAAYPSNGTQISSSIGRYLMFAFAFCAFGDLLLALEPVGSTGHSLFLSGMASFGFAHVCFIGAMIGGVPVSNINAKRHWGQLAVATLLLVFGVEYFILSRESFGDLKLAVLIYASALVVMSIAASLRMLHHGKGSYLSVLGGAVLFMTSDALLATVRFTDHIDAASFMILPTYFAAIGMLCYGFSIGKTRSDKDSLESGS